MRVGRSPTTLLSRVTADADFAMAGYKLTGLGAGSASGHSLRYQQAILQAILDTRGDMLYRAASVAARLAKGTDGQFLKIGAYDPEWADLPTLQVAIGQGARNSSGDQEITGVGFEPVVVILLASNADIGGSIGVTDASSHFCRFSDSVSFNYKNALVAYLYIDASNYLQAIGKSLDSDGFTLTWALVGTVTGTYTYICLR